MTRYGPRALLLLFAAAFMAGCDTTDPEPIRILVPREVQSTQYTTTESGLRYFDFQVGEGTEVGDSSVINLHYAAWLQNGNLLASSYSSETPIQLDLRNDVIIQGWVEGVPGMREGGERQLLIPPGLAYGDDGFPNAGIPPNATLIYEVEIISVEAE